MPRIGERGWIHSGVKVVDNAAAPTSWTDLELSAIVGKSRALVYLKVKNRTVGLDTNYHFRTNGDTKEIGHTPASAGGCTLARINVNCIVYLLLETSAVGVVEWKCEGVNDTDISVLGYIR